MAPDPNERMAVIENEQLHQKEDIQQLFKLVREHIQTDNEHMTKSEKDRQETLLLVSSIRNDMAKNKSFIGGVVFAATGMWAVLTTAAYWFFSMKH